jgi:hypothetical protein
MDSAVRARVDVANKSTTAVPNLFAAFPTACVVFVGCANSRFCICTACVVHLQAFGVAVTLNNTDKVVEALSHGVALVMLHLLCYICCPVQAFGVAVTFNNTEKVVEALSHGVALVDRSHWGRLRVAGGDRLSLLHNQSTADFKQLKAGQGCDTVSEATSSCCFWRVVQCVGCWGYGGRLAACTCCTAS